MSLKNGMGKRDRGGFRLMEPYSKVCEATSSQVPLPAVWRPLARLWRYSVLEPYGFFWYFFEHRDPACCEGWLRTFRWHSQDLCFAEQRCRPKVFLSDFHLGAEDIAAVYVGLNDLIEPEPRAVGIYDGPYYGLVLYDHGVQKTQRTRTDRAPFAALKQVFSDRLQQQMGWPQIEQPKPGYPQLGL